MTQRPNALEQSIDIAGTYNRTDLFTLSDENSNLGELISGQTGSAASITTLSGSLLTITGLTGMSSTNSPGRTLNISGAASGGNNGSFIIVEYVSATSVKVFNPSGVAADANSGAISWQERKVYSLESDLNYTRSDRKAIKGTSFYYSAIPTYQRPTAVGTNVNANLTNIAGKTTDAKAMLETRQFSSVSVSTGNTSKLVTSVGNLKHADATDRTGVPVFDGADAGDHEATYVEIFNPNTEATLEVLTGINAGKRIYGRTIAAGGTSPDSVTVDFRAVAKGADLSTSVAYTWEAGQPATVHFLYAYRQRLDNLAETALRKTLVNGLIGDANTAQDIADIRSVIGISDGNTSLTGLTNTGNFFPFVALDGTPSVTEALNILNAAIGIRDYTGSILVDGETITQSLQRLANAIAGSEFVRTVERLASAVNANTAKTLPGGQSYTLDGTNNGQYLVVYWRGALRDPGSLANNDDYAETSTTSITPFSKINVNEHINWFVYA